MNSARMRALRNSPQHTITLVFRNLARIGPSRMFDTPYSPMFDFLNREAL